MPIVYQGNTYNIPVDIWFPAHYPNHGAQAFVTPTAGVRAWRTERGD